MIEYKRWQEQVLKLSNILFKLMNRLTPDKRYNFMSKRKQCGVVIPHTIGYGDNGREIHVQYFKLSGHNKPEINGHGFCEISDVSIKWYDNVLYLMVGTEVVASRTCSQLKFIMHADLIDMEDYDLDVDWVDMDLSGLGTPVVHYIGSPKLNIFEL